MADGRHFTDYRPNCHLNNNLRTNNKLENTFDYRRFLQHRGTELINFNRSSAYQQNGCGTCKEPYHQNTILPEQTRLYCDKNGCKSEVVDPNGLGQVVVMDQHKDTFVKNKHQIAVEMQTVFYLLWWK